MTLHDIQGMASALTYTSYPASYLGPPLTKSVKHIHSCSEPWRKGKRKNGIRKDGGRVSGGAKQQDRGQYSYRALSKQQTGRGIQEERRGSPVELKQAWKRRHVEIHCTKGKIKH